MLQLFGKRKWNNHWHRNYRPTEVRNGLRSGRNRKLGAKKCVRKLFIHPIRCSRKRRTERLPQPLMCGCDMRKARRRFQYIYEVEVEKSDNCGEISCEEGAAKRTLYSYNEHTHTHTYGGYGCVEPHTHVYAHTLKRREKAFHRKLIRGE